MDAQELERVLDPYNPWWRGDAEPEDLPDYRRPIVGEVLKDIHDISQIISVTGPRRVGKSTAMKQVIYHLLEHQGLSPSQILYFSLDDPDVQASTEAQRVIFDLLVERAHGETQTSYFFLDEIQRLPQWELYLKKYYDLKVPIRFVVSGSASTPIFRKSQESLLGRIQDRHLLPFSFREYCEYTLRQKPEFAQIVGEHTTLRQLLLNGDGSGALACVTRLERALEPFRTDLDEAVTDYCREGGFPEVWNLTDKARKIEYLMEQQVRKVLYEDLMMATKYRRPENVLRFFVYLLGNPGVEINMAKVARESGVERRVVEENLPRLEKTDLILRIAKFTHKPLRVRQGNIKCYPVDPALRNAVMKTWDAPDDTLMGYYAENLVIRELSTWPEAIENTFFRKNNREVDFVCTCGGNRYLPIEVKYRRDADHTANLRFFMKKYDLSLSVLITRDLAPAFDERILKLPLRYFLLVV